MRELAESGSLENCCAGNRTVGSNPTLSAKWGSSSEGERIPRTDEVTGSNPVCSITFLHFDGWLDRSIFCACVSVPERCESWLNRHDWKSCVRATVPWVQIPLSPPNVTSRFESVEWRGGCALLPLCAANPKISLHLSRLVGGNLGELHKKWKGNFWVAPPLAIDSSTNM